MNEYFINSSIYQMNCLLAKRHGRSNKQQPPFSFSFFFFHSSVIIHLHASRTGEKACRQRSARDRCEPSWRWWQWHGSPQFINVARSTPVSQSLYTHCVHAIWTRRTNQPTIQHRPTGQGQYVPTYQQYLPTYFSIAKHASSPWHSFISYRKKLQQFGGSGCRGKADFMTITDSLSAFFRLWIGSHGNDQALHSKSSKWLHQQQQTLQNKGRR